MATPTPARRTGRHRRPVPASRPTFLSLLAVLALLLGSGTAVSLTAGAPANPRPDLPAIAALGDAPASAPERTGLANGSPPAASPAPAPTATREPPASRANSPSERTQPPAQQPTSEQAALENEVTERTNAERAAAGCEPVRTDERLRAAAREHSQDMATNDYFSHTGLDGRSPFDRMRDAGYPNPAGENIAMGYRTPADVMNGWMNSDGHRRNLLTCSHQAIGVGLAYNSAGRPYWTQVFGR